LRPVTTFASGSHTIRNKWAEFQARYKDELKSHAEQFALLKQEAAKRPVTLLYGAKDEEHNQAVVLQKLIAKR